ncbi:MAG TPA: hypothetical protein PKA64_17475, partial [Myxococcota bacterium]|nr:hypothetical protein [Myxococcota bacterium]
MLAQVVSTAVFFGVLVIAGLLWAVRFNLAEADRAELARRIGPGELAPHLLSDARPDLIARALGPLGAWMHTLRAR